MLRVDNIILLCSMGSKKGVKPLLRGDCSRALQNETLGEAE